MDDAAVERTLAACERELQAGRVPDLRALGFWRAVASVKRRRELVALHAERIARIDRAAFDRRVRVRLPAGVGIAVLLVGVAAGIALLARAASIEEPQRAFFVISGTVALVGATHGLGHLIVGSVFGIRFTEWFIDLPRRPQPGFKIDYASYLRAPPRQRAWMHAAGAIATKLTPFVVILYALAIRAETWAVLLLLALGLAQIVTDLLFSVKASDWKKFRREMDLARSKAPASK